MDSDGQVTGDAAVVYEEFFVPALFAEWAPRVATLARIARGSRVLDVACGTGVLAREAARLAGAGAVVGLDVNPGMLAVARRIEPGIDWRTGRAEELPFDSGSFDVVVSQFGLMFFADQTRALDEMWRVLRPGGTLVTAVWARLEDTPGYAKMVELVRRLFGGEIADELRAPFSLGESSVLRAVFDKSAVTTPRVETVAGTARFASIADWVRTEIRGWTLADKLDDDQFRVLAREAEIALAEFRHEGGVTFASPAHLVLSTKP